MNDSRTLLVAGWHVDPERNTLTKGADERRLEPRVMDLLVYLARHPGEVIDNDRLIRNVWPHQFVSDTAVQTAVSHLRRAFGDNPRHATVIETVPKRGYRLIASTNAASLVVAVLPFRGTADPALVDGLTDAVIGDLGASDTLRVLSRHSAMLFRERRVPLPEIADQLNASYVLDGSLQVDGDRVGVSIQLVDASQDTVVLAKSYSAKFTQLWSVAANIARDIADELGASPTKVAVTHTQVPEEALDAYLHGRFYWYQLNPELFSKALERFEAAIAVAPEFGAAHAGIADVWGALGYWGTMPTHAVRASLLEALQRALSAEPDSAEANMIAGAAHFYLDHSWQAARDALDYATQLNPNLGHAHLQRGLLGATLGEPTALDAMDRAVRADPLNPTCHYARAFCLAGTGNLNAARASLDRTFELAPAFPPGLELQSDIAWITESPQALALERALWTQDAAIRALLDDADANPLKALMHAADELENRSSYVSPRRIARLLSLGGDPDRALEVLHAAFLSDDLFQIDFLQLEPAFERVRILPAYRQLADAMGLP